MKKVLGTVLASTRLDYNNSDRCEGLENTVYGFSGFGIVG